MNGEWRRVGQEAMMQTVINAYPPLIDAIDAAFHTVGKPVFYSWGDKIFNPMGVKIGPALWPHEAVHGRRQLEYSDPAHGEHGIAAWWNQYIHDAEFRLAEEIPAHRAEFAWHAAQPGIDDPIIGFRSRRHKRLHFIASRLSGSLYGNMISLAEAKRLISE